MSGGWESTGRRVAQEHGGQRVMGYGLWATGYGLRVMGYGLWATGYGRLIAALGWPRRSVGQET